MSRSLLHKLQLGLMLSGLWLLVGCGGRPLLPASGEPSDQPTGSDFTDAFVPGQTGDWLLERDDRGSSAIVNEELVITIVAPNTLQYASLQEKIFGDFALEVDVTQRSGPAESSYGILFRIQDDQQFYRFDITGNGLYMIERHESNGTWTRLVPDWVPTSALNQGLNGANRLKVLASGPTLTFYANDELLTQVTDATFNEGLIGLDAGTFGGGNLQVSFDNLRITGNSP
ncbi:MAG: family 16 glycoside hydrolase [Chloroflexota bacterium]